MRTLTDKEFMEYEKQGIAKDQALKIEKMVYDDYPQSKKERGGCTSEKAKNDGLRRERRKRYIEHMREKLDYGL